MSKQLTITELEVYLKPLLHFGKLELKISDKEKGKMIEVYERDEYTYENKSGNMEQGGDLTRPLALYTSEDGVIEFIEHSYGAFTKANKESVSHVINLIDVTIVFE